MTEIQYPIRGTRFRQHQDEYYYLEEYNGLRLGDRVGVKGRATEGMLITIVRLIKPNEADYCVGIIRTDRTGTNGYATEHGNILGISDYDNCSHGHGFRNLESLYSGPCKKCISNCKGEKICAFYREEI